MTRFIVHIGDGKCGSSSIQKGLYEARDHLRARGILYETATPANGHFDLVSLAGKATRGAADAAGANARRTIDDIRRALETAGPDPQSRVLLSAESFFSLKPEDLLAILHRISPEITGLDLIAYVRAPHSMYLSLVQQTLKGDSRFPMPDRYARRIDRILTRWQQHAAVDSLTVHNFDRARLIGGDVVTDFAHVLQGLTGQGDIDLPITQENTSLSAEQMVVLQAYRRDFLKDHDGRMHPDSQRLIGVFDRLNALGFPGSTPALTDAALASLRKGNAPVLKALERDFPDLKLARARAPADTPAISWTAEDSVAGILRHADPGLIDLLRDMVARWRDRVSAAEVSDLAARLTTLARTHGIDPAALLQEVTTFWQGSGHETRAEMLVHHGQSSAQATPETGPATTGTPMIPAKDALARAKSNDHDRWIGGAEASARDRILSRVVIPMGQQSFRAAPGSTFFAVGSCFARNVEERLALAGADVLSLTMAARDLGATSGRALGIYNKYTPLSILQELQFASGERAFPEAAFLPAGEGLFYDSQLRVNSGNATIGELTARRAEIRTAFARIFQADVVILTLGLIEAWYDTETGLYLNEMPAPRLMARFPDRFAFRCLSVAECRAALEEIHAVLARHGKPDQKVVITVSPVALGRTFTEDDIIVANTTSKSTLRVAAMDFARAHAGIDYFPSYEAVTQSAPALAWQEDRLHASDFIVGRIINTFLLRYGLLEAAADDIEETAGADSEQALIARLRRDVDKYKNRLIQMEQKLKQAEQGSSGARDTGT